MVLTGLSFEAAAGLPTTALTTGTSPTDFWFGACLAKASAWMNALPQYAVIFWVATRPCQYLAYACCTRYMTMNPTTQFSAAYEFPYAVPPVVSQ